jgi:hypothetical protein
VAASFVRTGAIILLVVGAVVLVQLRKTPSALGLLMAAFLAAALFLVLVPQTTTTSDASTKEFVLTLNGRTQGWSNVIRAPDELLAGRGVGVIGSGAARAASNFSQKASGPARVLSTQQFQQYNIDSSYFATVADVGLVGLALLLAILGRSAELARRAISRGSRTGWAVVGLGAVVLTDSLTRSSLTSFPVGFVGMLLLGTALAAALSEGSIQRRT